MKKVPPLKIVHMRYVPKTTKKDEPDRNLEDFHRTFDAASEYNREVKVCLLSLRFLFESLETIPET